MTLSSNNLPNTMLRDQTVKRKYRFHIPGYAHLPLSRKYYPCAFTQKTIKLIKMLKDLGHEVFFYGAEGSESGADHFIETHTLADIRSIWGDTGNNDDVGYDWTSEAGFRFEPKSPEAGVLFEKIFAKMIIEINSTKKPDDFLVLTMGDFHKAVVEKTGILQTIETGVAYRGTMAKFRAFESDFMRNYVLGLQNVGKDTPNGAFYDRVIPNYFWEDEFPIESVKPDKKDRGMYGKEYILYMGRLIPRKGLNIALKLGIDTKTKIFLAGQGKLTGISPYVELLGVLDPKDRRKWMSSAKAVIVPSVYTEPFGGVGVEAMLCGTPILTTNFGVFPEYNINGVTGYKCDIFKDFVEGLKLVDTLDRNMIRKHAERYLMGNIKWEYQKWFDEIYDLCECIRTGDTKRQKNIWFER